MGPLQRSMPTHYFVDFDNTISTQDVWDAIVRLFAPDAWQELVKAYVRGEITSRECNLRLSKMIPPREEEARRLVQSIGIDPTFRDFVRWTKSRECPLTIVSDGYDYYIDLLLGPEGLNDLPCYSNKAVWTASGIEVQFPYRRQECERDMANCKCQHIAVPESVRRVYIGDGVSDFCAAEKCEQIYAKHDLLRYCQEKGVPCIPYTNFTEIMEQEERFLLENDEMAVGAV